MPDFNNKKIILIIEDDYHVSEILSYFLKSRGYFNNVVHEGDQGLDLIKKYQVPIVILDLNLPDRDGLHILKIIKEKHPGTEVIVITGRSDVESAVEAINRGAFSYIRKPFVWEDLVVQINRAIQKKKMEKELFQTEKLASISQLALDLAHKLHNPLAIISATAQYCKEIISEESKYLIEPLDIIKRNAESTNAIIWDLLSFAKPKEMKIRRQSVHRALNQVCRLIEPSLILHGIEVITDYSNKRLVALYDKDSFTEVLLNILMNSTEAIGKNGRINIKTFSEDTDGYVKIEIEDNGRGMSDEDIQKAFDPFYSTKEKGGGLGLSICHRIMNQINGSIAIHRGINQGTKVILTLPKA